MATLQEQLFTQFAAQALDELTEEYKKRYETKKGDRFHTKGITYEIGPPPGEGAVHRIRGELQDPRGGAPPEGGQRAVL